MTQAQIEKMFSIAMGSDIIEFVESLEKQAAIDALAKAERTPSNDVKEEAENYVKGIATNYQEQILTQGQLRIYAKKDFIAGYLACAKKAERMEEIEQKEPNPFAVQSLDRYDSGELGELLDVVRMAINGKVPTKYESLDLWAYRLRDAMDIKRKQL